MLGAVTGAGDPTALARLPVCEPGLMSKPVPIPMTASSLLAKLPDLPLDESFTPHSGFKGVHGWMFARLRSRLECSCPPPLPPPVMPIPLLMLLRTLLLLLGGRRDVRRKNPSRIHWLAFRVSAILKRNRIQGNSPEILRHGLPILPQNLFLSCSPIHATFPRCPRPTFSSAMYAVCPL